MMQLKYIFLVFTLFGLYTQSQAQEQLLDLQIDPTLNNYHRSHQLLWKSQQLNEPMFLPFFDDFDQVEYRPNDDLWLGDNVYINKKYQLFPPDLGVATFDAMDGSGHIHANASQFVFPADTLMSQRIRLDSVMDPVLRPMLVKDSVYMSFYYQPQGRGNAPEEADKLTLEFYAPILDQWYEMWSSDGMRLDTFYARKGVFAQQVFIRLIDSAKYFHTDFQFRFHNQASLAGNNQSDWQSNADHWNIDLVYLDRNRTVTDSGHRKIAFVNNPPSMIKKYQAMPYRQYKNDPTNSMKDTIKSILISNLDNTSYAASYSYEISDQTSQDSFYDGGTYTINPFAEDGYLDYGFFRNPRVISFFSIYNEIKKTYSITHIINDIGLTGVGDTAIREQEFSNYYAYDDGTPEAGYGLSVRNAKAAMKFQLNTKDTLRQIQMYFNPTLTNANDQYFDIMIWKSIDPEEVIYTKRVKPEFTEGLYTFHTYDLDTNIVLANEFYVGFRQVYAENLNVGFDYAIDSKEYLFYDIGTGWNPSIYSGSLMIRPVFGEKMSTAIESVKIEEASFKIYPNPLDGFYLYFEMEDENYQDYEVEIFNLTGQKIMQRNLEMQMDVSTLKNGIYLVRINHLRNGESNTKKLIIRK